MLDILNQPCWLQWGCTDSCKDKFGLICQLWISTLSATCIRVLFLKRKQFIWEIREPEFGGIFNNESTSFVFIYEPGIGQLEGNEGKPVYWHIL